VSDRKNGAYDMITMLAQWTHSWDALLCGL